MLVAHSEEQKLLAERYNSTKEFPDGKRVYLLTSSRQEFSKMILKQKISIEFLCCGVLDKIKFLITRHDFISIKRTKP
jgi:hypothetical protein